MILTLAIWTHGMVLWAACAHLVLLHTWGEQPDVRALPKKRFAVLVPALAALPVVPLGLTLLYAWTYGSGLTESPWQGNAFGGPLFRRAFVHFDATDWVAGRFTNYGIFSPAYLRRLRTLILCAAPGLFCVPLALRRNRETAFLGAALAGSLALLVLWNPDFGLGAQFCLFAVPTQILLLCGLVDHPRWRWIASASALASAVILPEIST